MKKIRVKTMSCIIICLCLILSGCTGQGKEKVDSEEKELSETSKNEGGNERFNKPAYISFTVTKEENDAFNMYTYTYSLEEKRVEQKAKLEYYAQYPLAVYSAFDNAIYYSYRDDKECDQLYKMDLETKKEERLTDSLFAINYIVPIKEKLYLVAVEKGERAMGLFEYKERKLTRILSDKDAFVWKLNVNPDIEKIAFNTYSQSELDKNMENNDGSGGIGMNTIRVLDIKNDEIKEVSTTDSGYITSVGLECDENIYYNLINFYKIEKGEGGLGNIDKEFEELDIYDLVYLNNKEIYYLDSEGSLIKYDRATKKNETVYSIEDEKSALNNAIVLYEES